MAKIMKKKMRIRMVSNNRGIAAIIEETMILNPSIPEIVLSGLSTLNDLKTDRLRPPPCKIIYK
jgi:hypothetical protein